MKKRIAAFLLLLALLSPAASGAEYTDTLINLVLRYNHLAGDALPSIERVDAPKTGKNFDSYVIKLGENSALMVQTKPGTMGIVDAMVIASGDGSAASGAEIMLTLGAFCGAFGFIDDLDGSYAFLEKAGLFKENALDGRQNKYKVDGHSISFAQVKGIGLMFTVSRPEN